MTKSHWLLMVVPIAVLVVAVGLVACSEPPETPTPEQPGLIDMVTDDDGNGIPDEFEREFRAVLELAGDPGDSDSDSGYAEALAAIEELQRRVPISEETRRGQARIATLLSDAVNGDLTQEEVMAIHMEIGELQESFLRDDPIHAAAMRHTETLLAEWEGDTFAPQ